MKTELDITRIMDDYTDNEFGIEGEQAVDTEKAVGELLAKVKPKKTIRISFFKVLIAAAALVCLTAIVGFTYLTYEWSIAGNSIVLSQQGNTTSYKMTFDGKKMEHPIRLEDNRVIFTYEGEETDITDLIDEETPFIYTYTNPATGWEGYIIAGGGTEDLGYANVYYLGEGLDYEAFGVNYYIPPEFDTIYWAELYEAGEIDDETFQNAVNRSFEEEHKKWFVSAWQQLGHDGYDDFTGGVCMDDFDEVLTGTYSGSMSH